MPNDGGAMFKAASSLGFYDNIEKHKHAESTSERKMFDDPASSSKNIFPLSAMRFSL